MKAIPSITILLILLTNPPLYCANDPPQTQQTTTLITATEIQNAPLKFTKDKTAYTASLKFPAYTAPVDIYILLLSSRWDMFFLSPSGLTSLPLPYTMWQTEALDLHIPDMGTLVGGIIMGGWFITPPYGGDVVKGLNGPFDLTAFDLRELYDNLDPFTQTVPEGALEPLQIIKHEYPPIGFNMARGWFHTAMLTKESGDENALVIVNNFRVIEKDAYQTERSIYVATFNAPGSQLLDVKEGGVFIRTPRWYTSQSRTPFTQAYIAGGHLTIEVSQTPDNIIKWWSSRLPIKKGAHYFLEISVKVIGLVALQLGLEYWVDASSPWNGQSDNCLWSNRCEAWQSDWIGDTQGKFVTLRVPQ